MSEKTNKASLDPFEFSRKMMGQFGLQKKMQVAMFGFFYKVTGENRLSQFVIDPAVFYESNSKEFSSVESGVKNKPESLGKESQDFKEWNKEVKGSIFGLASRFTDSIEKLQRKIEAPERLTDTKNISEVKKSISHSEIFNPQTHFDTIYNSENKLGESADNQVDFSELKKEVRTSLFNLSSKMANAYDNLQRSLMPVGLSNSSNYSYIKSQQNSRHWFENTENLLLNSINKSESNLENIDIDSRTAFQKISTLANNNDSFSSLHNNYQMNSGDSINQNSSNEKIALSNVFMKSFNAMNVLQPKNINEAIDGSAGTVLNQLIDKSLESYMNPGNVMVHKGISQVSQAGNQVKNINVSVREVVGIQHMHVTEANKELPNLERKIKEVLIKAISDATQHY